MNIVIAAAAAALALAGPVGAVELFVNGDFEAGNAGFSSGYVYSAPSANALASAGRYTVATNAAAVNPAFNSFGDTTTGNGKFLIVSGAATAGTTVWSRTNTAVVKGEEYLFKGFITGASAGNITQLDVYYSFDGEDSNILGHFATLPTIGEWIGIESHFLATGDRLTIAIVTPSASAGRGFGIDDLRLIGDAPVTTAVPEPAVWGMMLGGFGLVGAAARRRRHTVAA